MSTTQTKPTYIFIDDVVEAVGLTEEEVVEKAKRLQNDALKEEEMEPEWKEDWKDFEIKDIRTANEFLKEFQILAIENKDTECSLLIKRMLEKNEKCYFQVKTKEYDYFDQGYWRFSITPLLNLSDTEEVKLQIHATKHCPSGLWDNGIEKSKHFDYCPKAYRNLDILIKDLIRCTMSSSNYRIDGDWVIK